MPFVSKLRFLVMFIKPATFTNPPSIFTKHRSIFSKHRSIFSKHRSISTRNGNPSTFAKHQSIFAKHRSMFSKDRSMFSKDRSMFSRRIELCVKLHKKPRVTHGMVLRETYLELLMGSFYVSTATTYSWCGFT